MADSFRDGIIQPTLIKQLQNILHQYPDDGQILKELIQNAEDAGARNIKFMYDKSHYSTDNLYNTALSVHQGPALYAYNDAVFSEDDWKGIRMIQDSIKAKDPLKVGRFGLGFKSVFHITDLPGIMSGKQIGYLDPLENFFTKPEMRGSRQCDIPTSSYAWDLSHKILEEYKGQFQPFMHTIFDVDESTFTKGDYKGTLFRFPLRDESSDISKTHYTDEKIQDLVELLEKEGHFLILFLKHLESIEFYEKLNQSADPQLKLCIKITSENKKLVEAPRKEFVEKVRYFHLSSSIFNNGPIHCKYLLETEVKKAEKDFKSDCRKWVVIQSYGGGNTSDLNAILAKTQSLPIVGLALPLDEISTAKSGHVFCFLPLPLDVDNETGLNVHVNGYFAVDQNRRHLKWPSRGQSLDHSTDTDLKWNRFLLKQLIPIAMIELLQYAIQRNFDPRFVYKVFPEKEKLKEHWLPVFDKFVQNLQNLHCLYSIQNEWIRPAASYVLVNLEDKFKEVVKKVIIEGHVPLVEAPLHVLACVGDVTNHVDPWVVRQKLKMNDITLTNEDKMILLLYFLQEATIDYLFKLKLLPLADGSFEKFEKPTIRNTRYLESAECPNSLIPCRKNLFVHCEIDQHMYYTFAQIAQSGRTQVQFLKIEQVPQLLKNGFQQTRAYIPYSEPFNVGDDWLKKLWIFILQYHTATLHKYESLPVVPVAKCQWSELSLSIPYIAERTVERSLRDIGIKGETLQKLGIVIVTKCRELIGRYSNNEQLQRYISPPTIAGILEALMKVQNVELFFMNLSPAEKQSFKDSISGEYRYRKPPANHLKILKKMPLFKCYKTLLSTNEIWEPANSILCCSEFDYNFALPHKIAKYNECQEIARIMSVETRTSTKILLDCVFPNLLRGSDYTSEQITNLMKQILMKYDNWKRDYNFIKAIQSLPFISTKHRNCVMPSEVVDPCDAETKKLFELLDIFPTGKFAKVKYARILSQCGIFRSVSEDDIVDLTKYIDRNALSDNARYKKGMELLVYLNKQDHLVSNVLLKKICNFRWVPVKTEKPPMYPTTLLWYGQRNMCVSPREVLHSQHEYLVSSTKPLLPPLQICENVLKIFDWKKSPDIKDVVLQLAKIVTAIEGNTRVGNHEMFSLFIKEIYKFMNEQGIHNILQNIQLCKNWIWTGDSFTTNEHVVLQKPRVNAQPYVFHMPYDYQCLWSKNSLQQLGIKHDVPLTDVLIMIKNHHDHQMTTIAEQQRDLKLCIAILHQLRDGEVRVPTETPIPIRTGSKKNKLILVEIEKCVCCDQDTWKRKINIQDVLDTEEVDEIYEIHEDIPLSLAKEIGVPSLITRYLDAEPLPIDYGQSEPLTRRIKSLLEDYTDGSSVLKELLQNADDAGASSVSFIYDLRDFTNEKGLLFDENMRCLQGPSLLCHNDAEFTAEDFANIVKLSGATKKEKTEKIGRFGLGFNAVYNLTDVPSFVSGNNIVIFDPQVKYLGDAIKDPLQPAIKLDLEGHGKKIRRFKAQFEPFQNIMGCDVVASKRYRGTLFRFPLRNKGSDISAKCYDLKEVQSLFNLFKQVAHSLLLFSQNVTQINFYEIHHGTELISKGEVTKTPVHLLKSMTGSTHSSLTTEDKWKEEMKVLYHAKNKMDNVKRRNHYIIKTDVHMKEGKLFTSPSQSSKHWSVSNVIGTGKALEFARKHPGRDRLPVGSIAVSLEEISMSHYKTKPLIDKQQFMGLMFCFLPLPINCGMPFHVNGYFAVSSNRKQLCMQELYGKQDENAAWNIALIEDAVTEAHVAMLTDMTIHPSLLDFRSLQESIFQLFPISSEELMGGSNNFMFHFTESFYRNVIQDEASILPCRKFWNKFQVSKFPSEELKCIASKEFQGIDQLIIDECTSFYAKNDKYSFVDLPLKVLQQIRRNIATDNINEQLIDLKGFYRDIFLPNVSKINQGNCEKLLLFALLECVDELAEVIKDQKCIPVLKEHQRVYLKPSELVHPYGPLRNLFDVNDGPFPVWLTDEETSIKVKSKIEIILIELGMRKEYLPNNEIVQRAESIANLEFQHGYERCKCILALLDRTMVAQSSSDFLLLANTLQHIKMYPVLQKPPNWNFTWYAEQTHQNFLSVAEAYPVYQKELVGCSCLIAEFPNHSTNLEKALGNVEKDVQLCQINEQLQSICIFINSAEIKKFDYEQNEKIKAVMKKIYKYLDNLLRTKKDSALQIKENFSNRECIVVDCKINGLSMISPQICNTELFDGEPYLYRLPRDVAIFTSLVQTLGIQETFTEDDYINALERISNEENCISNQNTLTVIRNIATALSQQILYKGEQSKDFMKTHTVYLPDTKCVMTQTSNLCFNNCPWYDNEEKRYLHHLIPFEQAECLGVKTVRQEMLSRFQTGIRFGQREKLTNRIQRILEGYPYDKEILNELLQNADDAGAGEIHFILDNRHHPVQKIFAPEWEAIQGPALLVYNDKPFTEDDLQGIQNLGEGSKSLDPLTTGKYGVGFNCVYHITDTPTFLTATVKGDDRCLIALDPQCKYVPGSDSECPGQMWKEMETTKQMFPDVYKCFDVNLEVSKGTLFRFPLRTAAMAKSSAISPNETSLSDILELFKTFQMSMEDCLLFLNNVRKITLSEIDQNGSLKTLASAKATLNEKHLNARNSFFSIVKDSAAAMKQNNLESVLNMKFSQSQYEMNVENNDNKSRNWLIVQQLGLQDESNINAEILKGYKKKKAALLPRGGVAYCLDTIYKYKPSISHKPKNEKENVSLKTETSDGVVSARIKQFEKIKEGKENDKSHKLRKLYCFLPLPITVPYPVHINGYFVLDHESRRNLWESDTMTDFNALWNKLIFSEVIAACYTSVVDYVMKKIPVTDTYGKLTSELKHFMHLFPNVKSGGYYMEFLEKSIYRCMVKYEANVLPVLIRKNIWKTPNELPYQEIVNLVWHKVKTDGPTVAFFDNLIQEQNLQNISTNLAVQICKIDYVQNVLWNCRFPVTDASNFVIEKFQSVAEGSLNISYVNPVDILKFFIVNGAEYDSVRITNSAFVDSFALEAVLTYCKKDLSDHLEGLPFLLTGDSVLHVFKNTSPVLISWHSMLIRKRKDLFVDRLYLSYNVDNIESYLKPMTCKDLSSLLKHELPEEKYHGQDKIVGFNPDNKQFMAWLINLWKFIYQQSWVSYEENEISKWKFDDTQLQFLKSWCLLPVKTDKTELWPVRRSSAVVNLNIFGDVNKVLRKMNFPEPYVPFIGYPSNELMIKIMHHIVSDFGKPDQILIALNEAMQRNTIDFSVLEEGDHYTLLTYFNGKIQEKQLHSYNLSKEILKSLPLYKSKNGSFVSLTTCSGGAYTIPYIIPQASEWSSDTGNIYLCKEYILDELYKFVGVKHLEVEEAYTNHILHFFHKFSNDERFHHLAFLKTIVEDHTYQTDPKKVQYLLDVLATKPLLKNQFDTLETVSSFYDGTVAVFQQMETNFPQAPYNKLQWNGFLRKIGLVHELTGKLILKYAREIEKRYVNGCLNQSEKFALSESCSVLCDAIFESNKPILHDIADEIKVISFLPAQELSEDLSLLCDPAKKVPLLPFQGSSVSAHERLLWTKYPILSRWVKIENESLAHSLGLIYKPSLSDVIDNIRKVCNRNGNIKGDKISNSVISFVKTAFLYILNNHGDDDFCELKHINCVPVLEGSLLVKPKQVSCEISADVKEHLLHYLAGFPYYLLQFEQLLLKIGVTKTVTPEQFADVLKTIYVETSGEEIMAREHYAAVYSMKGLFEMNVHGVPLKTLNDLHLLATDIKMYKSNQLVYLDWVRFKKRITKLPMPQIFDISEDTSINVQDVRKAISGLPENIRPKFVSQIVEECLEAECLSSSQRTDRCMALEIRLSSDEFTNGLIRIIRNNNALNNQQSNDEEDLQLAKQLHDIRFYELSNVKTYLTHQDERLDESDLALPFHIASGDKMTVYLSSSKMNENNLISELCEIINILMNEKTNSMKMGLQVAAILSCNIEDIEGTLDDKNVLPYDAIPQGSEQKGLPCAGGYVPIKFHHLLKLALELLQIGEIVAYEVYDPLDELLGKELDDESENEDPVFRYAKVKEILKSESTSYRDYRYVIFLGEEDFITVHASELYRFFRPPAKSGPVVLSDKQSEDIPDSKSFPKDFSNISEIKVLISETLEEAWKMDENHKRKIMKRLFLEWHPDKNPDCIDLATDVFKFIQNEIERLEKGLSRSEVDGAGYSGGYGGFDFNTYYSRRARSHRGYSDKFNNDYSEYKGRSGGSSYFTPPRDRGPNPQPAEARRWLRQAEYDLQAVPNDMDYSHTSYEWACFKCHQAAEKALKATQFSLNANLKDNEHALYRLCNAINDDECLTWASEMEKLVISSPAMRYPDRHGGGKTTHDAYTLAKATRAVDYTQRILQKCRDFINHKWNFEYKPVFTQ